MKALPNLLKEGSEEKENTEFTSQRKDAIQGSVKDQVNLHGFIIQLIKSWIRIKILLDNINHSCCDFDT